MNSSVCVCIYMCLQYSRAGVHSKRYFRTHTHAHTHTQDARSNSNSFRDISRRRSTGVMHSSTEASSPSTGVWIGLYVWMCLYICGCIWMFATCELSFALCAVPAVSQSSSTLSLRVCSPFFLPFPPPVFEYVGGCVHQDWHRRHHSRRWGITRHPSPLHLAVSVRRSRGRWQTRWLLIALFWSSWNCVHA